jgi:HlyD family secretion protein
MKQRILFQQNTRVGTGLLFGLLILGLVACSGARDTPPAVVPTSEACLTYRPAAGSISANGTLKPARQVRLSFGVGGTVESVKVEIGEHVKEGQTLATLGNAALARAVAQAQVELESARARLARLEADAEPVPERVLAATAAITSARAALIQARVQAGQRGNQDVIDRWELEQAADALQDARDEYQKVLDDPRTTTWAPSSPQARDLDDAQERYDVVLAQYEMRAADHAYVVATADAEERLARAKLELHEVQHPVTSEELTLAELDVERAQLALEAAQGDLVRKTLTAPFDGIVSAVLVSVGEWTSPSAPVVELIDISRWYVETKNVGELQIARVREGQKAVVRVNAFQGEPLHGHVATISPVAVVQQGDTTYTLTIELESTDGKDGSRLNLRPGMTARVEMKVD